MQENNKQILNISIITIDILNLKTDYYSAWHWATISPFNLFIFKAINVLNFIASFLKILTKYIVKYKCLICYVGGYVEAPQAVTDAKLLSCRFLALV